MHVFEEESNMGTRIQPLQFEVPDDDPFANDKWQRLSPTSWSPSKVPVS